MKHHFGDDLDRTDEHWSIVPNRERWQYQFADLEDVPSDTSILTVGKNDANWGRFLELKQLRELTLHEPSKLQLEALKEAKNLTALRITHARPKSLAFLENLENLNELVLEYVSGIDDLTSVGNLPSLRSLHLENLRRVNDFSGLASSSTLKYLSIDGTLDWKQPVKDLDFLSNIHSIEFIRIIKVKILGFSPIFASLENLKNLKTTKISMDAVPLEDFAYLQALRPDVEGAVRPAYLKFEAKRRAVNQRDIRFTMPEEDFRRISSSYIDKSGKRYIDEPATAYLLGKGTRMVSGTDEKVSAKCEEHDQKYRSLVSQN